MNKVIKVVLGSLLALTMFGCSVSVDFNVNETQETESANETDFTGNYQDEVSQRATMVVTDHGESVFIQVSWSSGADQTTVWEMNAVKAEDMLVYSDCKKMEGDTVEYENEAGFFELKDGKLYWTGALEENCQQCVFSK